MYDFEQLFNFDFNSSGELELCIVITKAFVASEACLKSILEGTFVCKCCRLSHRLD